MPRIESFDLPGPQGRLEAALMLPDEAPIAVAVVCHPHPLHGGTMHSKVVYRAAVGLRSRGVAALRFNFRGVGRSQGVFDNGIGERDDVRAALDEAEGRFPGLPLMLGGFSFGSVAALAVGATQARVAAIFALGFPVAMAPEATALACGGKPRLFVQGERDAFGSGEELQALLEAVPGPHDVVVVEGADHFFEASLDAVEHAVATWAGGQPWSQDPPSDPGTTGADLRGGAP